jgi:calcineurin-like phosphoesterase family protein
MIYFIADTHFSHSNICRGTSQWSAVNTTRPFETLEAMNDYIIRAINRVVKPNDILYHLGDFAFGNKDEIPALRARIACQDVRLIMGNHDRRYVRKRPELFECFQDIDSYDEIRYNKLLISMCHYPLGSWNEIGKGGINLHGHCHNRYTRTVGRQMDVGVDALYHNGYEPISIDDVYDVMCCVEPVLVDGHNEETNYG